MVATWAGIGVEAAQLLLIGWGLWQMNKATDKRNRQLGIMEAANREQSQVFAELLRRPHNPIHHK